MGPIFLFGTGPHKWYSHSWKGNLLRSFGSSLLTTKLLGLQGSLTVYCTFVGGGAFYKWFVHIFILYCFVFNLQVDTLLGYFIHLEYIWRGIHLSRTNTIRRINIREKMPYAAFQNKPKKNFFFIRGRNYLLFLIFYYALVYSFIVILTVFVVSDMCPPYVNFKVDILKFCYIS